MRAYLRNILVLFYIIIGLLLIWFAFQYLIFKIILGAILIYKINLWIYIAILRSKRNKIDITTFKGSEKIKDLNTRIDYLNGWK